MIRFGFLRSLRLSLFIVAIHSGIGAIPITTNFVNGTSDETTWSFTQISTFNAAMTYLGSQFMPTYSGQNWTTNATLESLEAGTLAQAGPTDVRQINVGGTTLNYAVSLYNTVLGSEVYAGPVAEITFNINGINWNYATTPDGVAPGDDSFYTTAVHEMSHGLGFISLLKTDGTYYEDYPSAFDANLGLLNGGTTTPFTSLTPTELAAAYTSNSVYWTGENGNAANPAGVPIQIYAPNPAASGSSMSHIDYSVSPDSLLMYPSALAGQIESFTFSAMELGMFTDMGYSMVPEPGSAWLILFGGALFVLVKRRSMASARV